MAGIVAAVVLPPGLQILHRDQLPESAGIVAGSAVDVAAAPIDPDPHDWQPAHD